jgi:hypothetical protein
MTYAAYLRVYEPVSAFGEPARSRWAAYADSPARPRRRDCLATEDVEALRRVIAAPQVMVPERESEHAYIRRGDGVTYVCPWQTRLRCLLAYGQMLAAGTPPPGPFPVRDEDRTMAALAQLTDEGPGGRLHILGSAWSVPLAWFVPFAAAERWLALGSGGDRLSVATRALVYATPMSRARRRVTRGLAALRSAPSRGGDDASCDEAAWPPDAAEAELAEVGRWLEEFHPRSLVELDYGGLVHLLSDEALRGDESVAEIRAAIDGAATGEWELAVAMYRRAFGRWRAFSAFELVN